MQIDTNFKRLLSEDRLYGYTTRYAQSIDLDPIKIYKWNVALAESLYPLLEIVEVGLRNSINEAVAEHYADPDWLLDSQILSVKEHAKVQESREKYQAKYNKEPKIGKIISDLNLGFWVSLLDKRYDNKLWHQIIRQTFPFMPKNIRDRKHASLRFSKIRALRNRVFHFEPIWHWKDLLQQHDEIVEAIKWIDPALQDLVQIERFNEVYSMGPMASGISKDNGYAVVLATQEESELSTTMEYA